VNSSTVACIVVAAGRGERLGAGRPKAFVEVGGRTPLEHVARTVALHTAIDHLVVVVPADLVGEARRMLDHAGLSERDGLTSTVVAGGDTRQASVAHGLTALADSDDIVLVHDAARCLMPGQVYERVVEAIRSGHSAAIPVLPVVDTMKRVSDGAVVGTVDRSELRVVQTPQGFRRGVLFAGHEAAIRRGDDAVTDDAGLVERLGIPVHVVDGDDRGLKITRPFDLAVAGALAVDPDVSAGLVDDEATS
jgi:2-C-methyl-D-erythritol 4-phosphate cytidylyltransferase